MWKTDNLFAESPFLHKYLCNAGEGYRQQHADDAEKGAEDGDREQEAYKYLFTAFYGKGIDECNDFLEAVNVPTLGTQQRK